MAVLVARANEDRPLYGIILMLFAYFAFSLIDVNAKWLAFIGLPALQLAFMRYAGHFVVSSMLILRGGMELSRFGTERLSLVILRGVLLMLSTVFNFIAVQYLPLTLTSTMLFSAPIMICALSWPLLGERVGIWRWSAIMIGFCGILIAIRPFDESFHWAVLLSLGGAFCFALYSILTRKLSGIVASDTMQFYSGAIGTFVLLPVAFAVWESPETSFLWVQMICLGLFGWLGHEFLTRAHGFASASTLTPYGYTFILYMTVWSMLVFDHLPDQWTIVGAVIIITAGLIIWFRELRLSRKRKLGEV
ncbi:MAG: DMT family transporter [Rhizobiaceae bacterium]|nr:DMT family transporter [Rhizobiaceae bacterium]